MLSCTSISPMTATLHVSLPCTHGSSIKRPPPFLRSPVPVVSKLSWAQTKATDPPLAENPSTLCHLKKSCIPFNLVHATYNQRWIEQIGLACLVGLDPFFSDSPTIWAGKAGGTMQRRREDHVAMPSPQDELPCLGIRPKQTASSLHPPHTHRRSCSR